MPEERKNVMISARLPTVLIERLDYVARNTPDESVTNRSTAILRALETWLPGQEDQLRKLGVLLAKK